jgi:hypothetical protein
MERAVTGAANRSEYWRTLIAEQEQSGLAVARFCKDHGISEQSFYVWRKRLRKEEPVRFALVEAAGRQQVPVADSALELVFPGGERLRIGVGVDAEALRTVLEVLRR